MSGYAADDVAFIATRLKEIEEEKRKARERKAEEETAIITDIDHGDIYAGW